MKTFIPTIDAANRKWYVVDLDGATLGRVAVQVATILRGKHRPTFTPHLDAGDNVIVINAGGVRVTGNFKTKGLKYYRYTGYPGGLRTINFEDQMKKHPEDVFSHAVWRMLPKNRLGRKMFKKLHVYPGAQHPHAAQKPEMLKLS
jgi:large subunit ribosomal protein L13